MVENALQRDLSGFRRPFVPCTNYNKLCLSLLSGLPNEQELALNVCTILSNEGSHVLHLEQAPKLVDLLVAQTGVWHQDDIPLKMLYLESWKDLEGRNMHRFWRSTLDLRNSQLLKLLGLDLGEYDPDEALLNLETELGTLNAEGQRVLKVALILHNLSFEKNNVPILVHSTIFIRFLLLSIHSSWANLKQTAYDTLANIAYEIKLCIEKDSFSRLLFQTVIEGLKSPDRFMSIRSMDILSQFCSCDPNEDIIPSQLDAEIYEQMVSFLTVHDIMLLFYTLEALYALSDLGRYACDKIACVHGSIGILVSLLTLEPSQYGSSAEIKMKIVEILVPAEADNEQEQDKSVSVSSSDAPTIISSITALSKDVTSETFANNWLKSNYEAFPGCTISRNEIYAEYVGVCTKAGRKGVVNANVFANCVKSSFPQCEVKKVQSGSGIITFHHDGLRKKRTLQSTPSKPPNITVAVTSTHNLVKPLPKPVQSPILKAQLSAPSKSEAPAIQTVVKVQNSSTPSTCSAPTSFAQAVSSSTLIKSLLASKVQQRNVQRQVVPLQRQVIIQNAQQVVTQNTQQVVAQNAQRQIVPQNVSKMVIFSPGKMNTGIMRCVVPQVNIRSPLQGARLIAAAPNQSNPILQPKVFQQQAVIATTHVNGTQNDTQVEVCSKSRNDLSSTPVNPISCVPNHVTSDSLSTKDSLSGEVSNLQSSKDSYVNASSDQSFILSQIQGNTVTYRLAGPDDLPLSSGNRLFVRSNSSTDGISPPKEQNGSGVFINSKKAASCLSLMTQPLIQPKTNSDLLKSVLVKSEEQMEDLPPRQPLRKEEICKKSPLLNGLLDKGKASGDILFNALVENGIKASDVGLELSPVQSSLHSTPLNSIVMSASSLNSVIRPTSESIVSTSSESIIVPVSSESVIVPASSLNSVILPASSLTSTILPLSSSTVTSPISTSPAISFNSNGANVVQIRTGKATFSGTAEVQPDQKGVVRLHIESPENSNQGSDLSSISDIARTLECASEAISRTNAECNTQVPQSSAFVTTMTGTMIGQSTATLTRPNQQIFVVTPALSQPQLQIQSPNIKFCILHTVPMAEESMDVVGMPQINLNHLQQATLETPSISTVNLKRPSSDPLCIVTSSKKPRVDAQTHHLSMSTPGVTRADIKLVPDASETAVPVERSAPKISPAKAVPVSNTDLPTEREAKTFSGLTSASGNPPTSPAPSTSSKPSSTKLEYVCEWKGCGLKFIKPGLVFLHASKIHTPACDDDMVCLWEGCDQMKRRRFSLLTHLQDWHCNERVLHHQAMRRMQILQQGQSSMAPPPKPPPHPGYAPDAAVLAIKRHALQYNNPKELSEEKESALTKSIRLTSALILRNLVMHSSLARTYTRRFEPELAYLAMSPVESAKAIAQCLSHLSRSHD